MVVKSSHFQPWISSSMWTATVFHPEAHININSVWYQFLEALSIHQFLLFVQVTQIVRNLTFEKTRSALRYVEASAKIFRPCPVEFTNITQQNSDQYSKLLMDKLLHTEVF